MFSFRNFDNGPSHDYENINRDRGGICIPNSTTEVWTVIDVVLLN